MNPTNNTILQKCVDELKTEKPDLSYIRGMIETLIAVAEKPPVFVPNSLVNTVQVPFKAESKPVFDPTIDKPIGRTAEILNSLKYE